VSWRGRWRWNILFGSNWWWGWIMFFSRGYMVCLRYMFIDGWRWRRWILLFDRYLRLNSLNSL